MEASENQGLITEILSGAATLLELGGPVVGILIAASVLGLALALVKFIQFSGVGRAAMGRIDKAIDVWQQGDHAKALKMLDGSRLPIAADIRFGLEKRSEHDPDILHDELLRRAAAFLRAYSRNLRPLELIYYLAPVLGLLGTVLGMIEAFKGLAVSAGASGESSALAGGIWEALLTTAVGLSIAIPFAVMHALLESRLEFLADEVTDLITRVLTLGADG
ncbi:MAG: MotA/TolQ/ExbB proton channel family protein [Gammaproteobacteria bacterium]|nr:MotA/TolQ/ExbB proton channel family protein [Gammaproteobacteria bacterium]